MFDFESFYRSCSTVNLGVYANPSASTVEVLLQYYPAARLVVVDSNTTADILADELIASQGSVVIIDIRSGFVFDDKKTDMLVSACDGLARHLTAVRGDEILVKQVIFVTETVSLPVGIRSRIMYIGQPIF